MALLSFIFCLCSCLPVFCSEYCVRHIILSILFLYEDDLSQYLSQFGHWICFAFNDKFFISLILLSISCCVLRKLRWIQPIKVDLQDLLTRLKRILENPHKTYLSNDWSEPKVNWSMFLPCVRFKNVLVLHCEYKIVDNFRQFLVISNRVNQTKNSNHINLSSCIKSTTSMYVQSVTTVRFKILYSNSPNVYDMLYKNDKNT